MEISKEHIIDCGDKSEDGSYDFYYEFDLYKFKFKSIVFLAKSYKDESELVSFFGVDIEGKREMIVKEQLKSDMFVQAVEYLRGQDFKKIDILTEVGYAEYK